MRGRLIVFEGPDGVGKSTLAAALSERLTELGGKVLVYAFPGNEAGSLGKAIHNLHHDPAMGIGPNARQALHIAAHIDAVERVIRPAFESGDTVILDRYLWSTLAYGKVFGADERLLQHLVAAELEAWDGMRPDFIFLVDRGTPFRREGSKRGFAALRRAYASLINDPRWQGVGRIVRNVRPVSKIVEQLVLDLEETRPLNGLRSASRPQPSLFEPRHCTSNLEFSRSFLRSISPLKPTSVFATYWYFAAERQRMFFRRLNGDTRLTEDPILQTFRFTNAYRAADRVSQYLIRNIAYGGSNLPEDLVLRVLLFKVFNKIETWERLRSEVGEITVESFNVGRLDRILTSLRASGIAMFSAAYIMPSRSGELSSKRKHRNYLELIAAMLDRGLPPQLKRTTSLREAFELLRAYPLLGDFLALQFAIDLNYSALMNHSENEFVVPGPGARSGIRKCFESTAGLSEADVIRLVMEMQRAAFDDLGLQFADLWGRPLQLIDCQNLFCETDKYARLAHPDVQGLGDRTRIKQQFRPKPEPILVWFPPKWGLNERIAREPYPDL